VPGAITCVGWNAILTRPDNSEIPLAIPANGGPVSFSGLAAGIYRVRLFNGISTQQWAANPIVLTSTYVNMNINSTAVAPSCLPTSSNYVNNRRLTINVPTGGIGPFEYSVIYSLGTQVFSTPSRSHIFTGFVGNETVAFTVFDLANNGIGCPTSQTQTRVMPINTLSLFFEGSMAVTRRCRTVAYTACDNAVLLRMRIRQTGAPMVTHWGQYRINGGAWSAPTSGTTDAYHEIFAVSGDLFEFRAYNNCDTIYRSGTVSNAVGKTVVTSVQTFPSACGFTYRINLDDQNSLCYPTMYLLERFNGSTWDSISICSTTVRRNSFNTSLTDSFRVTINDGCNTLTLPITINQATPSINSITIREGNSTIAGTSSIYFNPLPSSSFVPLTITITPLYAYTNPVTITATQPRGLAGSYNITFPYTRIFDNTGGTHNHVLADLPLGQYQVLITDSCGNSITRTVNLTQPTTYNPVHNVVIGCANSNTLNYNLNSSHRFGFKQSTSIGMFELIRLSNSALMGTTTSDNMVFNNLPSGFYVLRAVRTIPDAQLFSSAFNKFSVAREVSGMQTFDMDTIFVPPYQNISVSTQAVACDNTLGVISATITAGTPVYPLIYNLYNAAGTVLIRTDTAANAAAANATSNLFQNIPLGNYVLNIISGYTILTPNGCFSSNQNVSYLSSTTMLTALDSFVCVGSTNTQIGILVDTAYWNITWYNNLTGAVIGTNVNTLNVAPTATTMYSVQYQLKSSIGCIAPPMLIDSVLITVINVSNLGIVIVGDTVCAGSTANISIVNATIGVTYEVFRNGSPLSPSITNTASANGLLGFVIPSTQLTNGLNTFQIRASNNICNGGILPQTVAVFVDAITLPPVIIPINGVVCPNTNLTLSVSTAAANATTLLNWYSGANGSGTLLGSGNNLVIAPTGTQTIYARFQGDCNITADDSIIIATRHYIYAANNTSTNNFCTDNLGWHHFHVNNDIIFSVKGDISAAPAGFPMATIYDNNAYYQNANNPAITASCANGWSPGEERFEMERSWNLNMGGGATSGNYEVRFYYQPAEKIAIESAAANWLAANPTCGYTYKYPTPSGFYWFKNTGTDYTAPLYDGWRYNATIGTTDNNINYSEWANIPNFSGGSGAIILVPDMILAAQWQYFKGYTINGQANKLEWATALEENTNLYKVQRSRDGANFETIGTVAAAGNSREISYYSFDDVNPFVGQNYYRIELLNNDLTAELSNVLVLNIAADNAPYNFYPNPTKDELFYQFNSPRAEPINIEIIDILGRVCYTQTATAVVGLNNISSNISALVSGSYIIRVSHLQTAVTNSAKIIKN
jgi:hypothetical protein